MSSQSEKHSFALFWDSSLKLEDKFRASGLISLDNPDLHHRIQTVLRLKPHEHLILFDRDYHVEIEIMDLAKKNSTVRVKQRGTNQQHQPHITCVVPLLKREALEYVVDALTQLGATTIQLVTTHKGQRSWSGQKEFDRLQRIVCAAAEQSKNYAFPKLEYPLPLIECIKTIQAQSTEALFFDPQGIPILDAVKKVMNNKKNLNLMLIIGPEGDLTADEKQLLKDQSVLFTKLTPTVLRAEQAIALGLGVFRSVC